MLNIGHRGAMGHETENTLASVQKALELGVDRIEIDVFVLKTGEVVVFHDETLDRLTDASGNLEDYSFEDLRKVIVRGGHQIPTLQEVIETIKGQVPLNIELKGNDTAEPTFKIVSEFITTSHKKEDFIISSFLWEQLEIYRNLDSEISIAVLSKENGLDALAMAEKLNAFSINPFFEYVTEDVVDQIHNKGFKILPYTVNNPEDLQIFNSWGVDGVFCNYPDIFNKAIRRP